MVFLKRPQPVAFSKLVDGLFHLVDDGVVVVGDVEGDGTRREEEEGLARAACFSVAGGFSRLEFKTGVFQFGLSTVRPQHTKNNDKDIWRTLFGDL